MSKVGNNAQMFYENALAEPNMRDEHTQLLYSIACSLISFNDNLISISKSLEKIYG